MGWRYILGGGAVVTVALRGGRDLAGDGRRDTHVDRRVDQLERATGILEATLVVECAAMVNVAGVSAVRGRLIVDQIVRLGAHGARTVPARVVLVQVLEAY